MNSTSTQFTSLLDAEIEHNVATALAEDVGSGDLNGAAGPADAQARATVIARENAVLCGTAWFECSFKKLDQAITVTWQAGDGDRVVPGQVLCEISGPARALLTGERTALNFLQLLSGVATKAAQYADVVAGTRAQVVDTHQDAARLASAQKYAVQCGGGGNHRIGLYDAILIKENHILAAGSINAAVAAA